MSDLLIVSDSVGLFDIPLINYIFMFAMGACLGSFGNVVILRLPKEESLMGRSRCGSCQKSIPWYQNIPIFAYFFLRGQCSQCHTKFSVRYPMVELLMAVLFTLVYHFYGSSWLTLEYTIMVWGLVVSSFIDWDHMILPNEITYTGLVIGLVGAALNPERAFLDGFFGFLFGGGVLYLVSYVYFVLTGREGLGGGDIKLLAWLGAVLGWKAVPFIILSSSVVGSIAGIYMNRKAEDKLKAMIPFGPFIALGAVLYILGLKSVGHWYVELFFPSF